VVGDAVFVVTDRAGMYRVSAQTGEELWWTPQVKRFVSASQDKIYCMSDAGQLLIIDQETGGRIGAIPAQGFDLEFINWRTDRLYLGTKFGVVQCLHDAEQEWPLVHVAGESLAEEEVPEVEQKGLDEVAADDKPKEADPFAGDGADEDPFAGDGGADDDPFGGGGGADDDDPFGGGGDADDGGGGADDGGGGADDDPFGGGGGGDDDPFGGGGADDDPFG
jgi:hypothetical protein